MAIRGIAIGVLTLALAGCGSGGETDTAAGEAQAGQADLVLEMTTADAPCATLGEAAVRITNRGEAAGGATQLALSTGTGEPTLYEMQGLEPGASVDIHPLAPPTPPAAGTEITVTVDPNEDVAESDENNNSASFACRG